MADTAAASDPGTTLQPAVDHHSDLKAERTAATTEAAGTEAPETVEAPATAQSAAGTVAAAAPAAVSAPPAKPVAMSIEEAAALAALQHDSDEDDAVFSPQQVRLSQHLAKA